MTTKQPRKNATLASVAEFARRAENEAWEHYSDLKKRSDAKFPGNHAESRVADEASKAWRSLKAIADHLDRLTGNKVE